MRSLNKHNPITTIISASYVQSWGKKSIKHLTRKYLFKLKLNGSLDFFYISTCIKLEQEWTKNVNNSGFALGFYASACKSGLKHFSSNHSMSHNWSRSMAKHLFCITIIIILFCLHLCLPEKTCVHYKQCEAVRYLIAQRQTFGRRKVTREELSSDQRHKTQINVQSWSMSTFRSRGN